MYRSKILKKYIYGNEIDLNTLTIGSDEGVICTNGYFDKQIICLVISTSLIKDIRCSYNRITRSYPIKFRYKLDDVSRCTIGYGR